VRDRQFLHQVMSRCRVVCHLAEIPSARVKASPQDEIYWGNAQAGSAVMQTAADLKIHRVLYASSCQVYGCWDIGQMPPVRLPLDETHPLRPSNVYALAKICNEEYAGFLHRQTKMPISIFRFPWVLTDTEPPKHFFDWVLRDDGPMHEMGTHIHASDLASAFVAAIAKDLPGCHAYNIFAPEALTMVPVRDRLARHHADYPPLPADWPDFKSVVLADKARNELGWQPKWNFRDFLPKK